MKNNAANVVNQVVSGIVLEIDQDHAAYQNLYRKYYGQDDETVKQLNKSLNDLCTRIKKEILNDVK